MNLIQLLKYISTNYTNESQNHPFKNNSFIRTWKENLNTVFPFSLLPPTFTASFSTGKGRWAKIPWMALIDKEVTTSVQHGVSIVFLFTSDCRGVYLTLNQGWTFFEETYGKNAKENISIVSKYFQESLKSSVKNNSFSTDRIHLDQFHNHPGSLGRGYEAGTIFNKYYDITKLNSQRNNDLVRDVLALAFTYQQLKATLDNHSFAKTASNILAKTSSIVNTSPSRSNSVFSLHESTVPYIVGAHSSIPGRTTQTNYLELAKRNSELGRAGEEFVMDWERQRLSKSALLKPYVNKVQHVSSDQGDGLGYDILSYALTPGPSSEVQEIHIEVKTTASKNSKADFFISANEWSFLNTDKEQFRLYRVYNFNDNPKLNIFTSKTLIESTTHKASIFQISFK